MDEKKKQDVWDAIGKLKLRDRLVLLFTVIAIGVALAVGIFYLLLSTSNIKFHIPESTLRRTADAQKFRQATYTDYPYTVRFPGTNYTTTVGGTEGLFNDYVTSFIYDEEQLLVLGVFDDTVSINEFYSYALVSAIDKTFDASASVYTSMLHDEGYMNATPLIYEAGKLTLNWDYYLISYIYHTDDGKNLLMMALTPKANQDAVSKSKTLVDKMVYSMGYIDESSADSDEAAATDVGGAPASDKYALDKDAEDNMTTAEKMETLDRKVDESSYALEYPEATDLEYYVLVSEDIEDAVFYIDYTEVKSVPEMSFLKSPSGSKYAPTYNNGSGIGLVYWEIDNPQLGNWLIHLSKNAKYGQFFAGVLPKAEFESRYIENTDPQPRNGQ